MIRTEKTVDFTRPKTKKKNTNDNKKVKGDKHAGQKNNNKKEGDGERGTPTHEDS